MAANRSAMPLRLPTNLAIVRSSTKERLNSSSRSRGVARTTRAYLADVSKNLADHLGYCIFAGTIKGRNQLFKMYEKAKSAAEWFALWQDIQGSLETEDDAATLMLRQAMHDDQQLIAKGLMLQEEYDQEWFLSTEAAIRGAYYAKQLAQARREGRIRIAPHDAVLPVHDVWDLGKGENMAVGCFQRTPGREMHFIHYLEGTGSEGIPHLISKLQALQRERGWVFGKHFAPHDIRATELGTGKTRYETAKRLGWEFTIVRDIGVNEGINAGRLMFARLWVDETNCAQWLDAIGHYRRQWFEKLGVFGPDPVHDGSSHPADMSGTQPLPRTR
jgi:phage terminase large subunit